MKVVTFGELMVRLQPFNYERFVQANSLEFSFGGGEANVAVSLANYGMDAVYVTKLCEYVDVCISNEVDAKDVFGIEAVATDIYGGKLNAEGYKSVAKQLADKFHFEKVAITLRESHSAFDNGWSAMLYDVASNEYCFSKKYDLHIIDRVGGGDSFGGGLIYSLLTGKSTQEAVEFAVAASALKHSIEGDYNMMTVSEVEKLAGGDGSGRIQR